MYKEANRPAWVELNLSNAVHNIQSVKKTLGPNVKIMAILKADGYGHGAVPMARLLKENGVTSFGVAALSEAIALRDAGIKDEIVILGIVPEMYVDVLLAYDLTPVICSYENASAISKEALATGKLVSGFIAVDTGMGRIGYLPSEPDSIDEIKKILDLKGFAFKGLLSHFATADAADKSYASLQEKIFSDFYKALLHSGTNIPGVSFANSAGVMEIPTAHYDIVRPGIILYGCYPSDEVNKSTLDLKPVMSVKANIVQIKKVGKDFAVSYGCQFISKRESIIATITLGYADGYPRSYSPFGKVIVNGVYAPLAGTICMDQCMIDVTDVPGVKLGDEVIIMGSDGLNTILADDIAKATGTINYEIVCAFGQRLPKVYMK